MRTLTGPPHALHWHSEPIKPIEGTIDKVRGQIPTFTRIPFGSNPWTDVIVNNTPGHDASGMPVATVSKSYVLVQHHEVLDAALKAIEASRVSMERVDSQICLTEHGTRMAARFRMPRELSLDNTERHRTDLTFECFNSVDCSVPLFALVGWFRLVCSNGMMVGTTTARYRRRHAPPLEIGQLAAVLRDGLQAAEFDRAAFGEWRTAPVDRDRLPSWIDGPVTKEWGAIAAGRVYHIVRTGKDGTPEQRFEKVKPHERVFSPTTPVPGSPERSETMFDIAQALSWVASHRDDFQQRLTWRAQISRLMLALGS